MNALAGLAAGIMAFFGASTTVNHVPPARDDVARARATSTVRAQADIACVAAATAAREQSLGAGMTTYTRSVNAAYTARASALASAYTQTGNDAIRKVVKSASSAFGAAIKVAHKNWTTARTGAWSKFRSALKACGGASASISDESNASLDAAVGQ